MRFEIPKAIKILDYDRAVPDTNFPLEEGTCDQCLLL
jgi:hypothetical protein